MSLSNGAKLGPYEILAPLGAGGMGEVYRARDTRLGREVAVKVLPASVAADPDRLRRFELEARATGMLNHPNILAVYDVGTHEGTPYLVTELLEGQTLRNHLPVTRRKALEYARQVALGLAAAHNKGVTHRDLKPENLFITTDGRVKILDFGIAKLTESAASGPEERTLTAMTNPGVAMGTAGYMSPEQVRGQAADPRSDLFSLGAILYEMLSGQRAFQASSPAETMSAILKEDPPPLTDPALDRLVRQCLEKNPGERFQSARDLSFNLETLAGSAPSSGSTALPAASTRRWSWQVAAFLVLALGLAADLWIRTRRPAQPPVFTGAQLGGSSIAYGPRLSPDGRTLAFQAIVDGQSQVAVMNPQVGNWTVLTRDLTRGPVINIAWSADSSRIYFDRFADVPRGIYSIPVLGGEERLVVEDAAMPEVLPDGSLLGGRINAQGDLQLHRFTPQSGRAEPLNVALSPALLALYRPFPDGREVAYMGRPLDTAPATGNSAAAPPPHLYILDLATGRSRALAPELALHLEIGAAQPVAISADGDVLTAVKAGDIYRVVSIPRRGEGAIKNLLTLTGPPFFLDVGPDGSLYVDQWARPYDVLRFPVSGGTPERLAGSKDTVSAAYFPLTLTDGRVLLLSQFGGKRRLLIAGPAKDGTPFVDTDEETGPPIALIGEQHVAFQVGSGDARMVAIATAEGRMVRRLAETKGLSLSALAASPDQQTLYYASAGSVWAIPASGGSPRKLTSGESMAVHPNGREIVVQRVEKDGVRLFRVPLQPAVGAGEQAIPLAADTKIFPTPLSPNAVRADGRILLAAFSPDSWFQTAAVLNPETGKVERVHAPFSGDIFAPGWTKDGRIVAAGFPMRSAIWRFQPEGGR